MRKSYIIRNFKPKTLNFLLKVNEVLGEYRSQGYQLTIRQLYYQMVSRGFIENSIRSYKNAVSIVGDGRLAGMVDWDMIIDRNREVSYPPHWENPAEIVSTAANQFRIDKWENQEYYIEVMVEKDALSGVLEPVCEELDIRFTANKGYNSLSNMREVAQRFMQAIDDMKIPKLFYLGDHDPSGIDMTRDVEDRLSMFAGTHIDVERLALNMSQVEEMNPPPNPAKETDSRFARYMEKFGETSWELDAIEPTVLVDIVKEAVYNFRDVDLWEEAELKEKGMKVELQEFVENYKAMHK